MGSVLTIDTRQIILLAKKIGDVRPCSHFQTLRYPFQAHGSLGAHFSRKRDLVWIALAPLYQFCLPPTKFPQPRQDNGLRSLFISLVAFARMMVLAHRTGQPIEQTRYEILPSERPASAICLSAAE